MTPSERASNASKTFWERLNPEERKDFCQRRAEKQKTHGLSKHPLYNVWKNMVMRCYNQEYPYYKDWGGRGIGICDEWKEDSTEFVKWALENGYKKGLEIDRRDNDQGYSPENCRFVTEKIQASNRRKRVLTEAGMLAIREAVIASNKRRARHVS